MEEKRDGGERVDLTTTLAAEHGMQLKKKKKKNTVVQARSIIPQHLRKCMPEE